MKVRLKQHFILDKFLHYMLYSLILFIIFSIYHRNQWGFAQYSINIILIADMIGIVLWIIKFLGVYMVDTSQEKFTPKELLNMRIVGLNTFEFFWISTLVGFILYAIYYQYWEEKSLIIYAFFEILIRYKGVSLCSQTRDKYLNPKKDWQEIDLQLDQSSQAILVHNLMKEDKYKLPKYSGNITVKEKAFFLDEETLSQMIPDENEAANFREQVIQMFCYLISPSSQEDLNAKLDVIYESCFNNKESRMTTIIVVIRVRNSYELPFDIPEKYENYKGFQYFDTQYETAIQPERLWNTYFKTDQKEVLLFSQPNLLLQLLPNDQVDCFQDGIGERNTYEFLRSALLMHSISQSVMALLDYAELILRCATYYCFIRDVQGVDDYLSKQELNVNRFGKVISNDESLTKADLQTLGQIIHASVNEEDQLLLSLKTYRVSLNSETRKIFIALEKYINYEFQDDSIGFIELCNITRQVRNRIIAHGSLEDDNKYIVWRFLSYGMLLLTNYLSIDEFHVELKDKKVYCGYSSKRYYAGQFFKLKGDRICLLHRVKNSGNMKQCEFINYFDGDLITPNIYEDSDVLD